MERHDYELKQREDNMVSILAEDVFAKMYSVNILFEYKDNKYIAWGEFDEGLYLSDYWGVDTQDKGEVKWNDPMYDKLEEIAYNLLSEYKITKDNLDLN